MIIRQEAKPINDFDSLVVFDLDEEDRDFQSQKHSVDLDGHQVRNFLIKSYYSNILNDMESYE